MSALRSTRAVLDANVAEPPLDLGDTGRDLYAATAPLAYAERETDFSWARFLAALSLLLDPVSTIVRDDEDGNPGWTALASPRRCPEPWLRVLAQWAGIRRWDAMSPDALRELIGPRAPGLWRGTRSAMIAAARRFLPSGVPDADLLYFEERADGDPYQLRVFTYTFIEHDPVQVLRALEAAKPAGLHLIYEIRRGQSWGMVRDNHADWAQVKDVYRDWISLWGQAPHGQSWRQLGRYSWEQVNATYAHWYAVRGTPVEQEESE